MSLARLSDRILDQLQRHLGQSDRLACDAQKRPGRNCRVAINAERPENPLLLQRQSLQIGANGS